MIMPMIMMLNAIQTNSIEPNVEIVKHANIQLNVLRIEGKKQLNSLFKHNQLVIHRIQYVQRCIKIMYLTFNSTILLFNFGPLKNYISKIFFIHSKFYISEFI